MRITLTTTSHDEAIPHLTELGVADGAAPGLLFDHLVFVRRAMEGAGPPEVTSPAVLVDDRDDPLRVSPDEIVDLLMDHVTRLVGREVTLGDDVPPLHDVKAHPETVVIVLAEPVQVSEGLALLVDRFE